MKFLLDENLSLLHARTLRALGHDAVSVAELGLCGSDDSVVRDAAIKRDRMLRLQFDLVVNLSGRPLPDYDAPIREWEVADPVAMSYEDHCKVRDEVERLVMGLSSELRRESKPSLRGQGSGRLKL